MKKSIYTSFLLACSLVLTSCSTKLTVEKQEENLSKDQTISSITNMSKENTNDKTNDAEENEELSEPIKNANLYVAERKERTLEDVLEILNYFAKGSSEEDLSFREQLYDDNDILLGPVYQYSGMENIALSISTWGDIFYENTDLAPNYKAFAFDDQINSPYSFNPDYDAESNSINLKKAYPLKELSFMSFNDAKALAEKFLKDLNYENYKFFEAYSLDQESSEKILNKKLEYIEANKESEDDSDDDSYNEKYLNYTESYLLKFQILPPNGISTISPLFQVNDSDFYYGIFNGEAQIYITKDGVVAAKIGPNWNFKETGKSVDIIDQKSIEEKANDYLKKQFNDALPKREKAKLILLSEPTDNTEFKSEKSLQYVYLIPYQDNTGDDYLIFDAVTGELLPIAGGVNK